MKKQDGSGAFRPLHFSFIIPPSSIRLLSCFWNGLSNLAKISGCRNGAAVDILEKPGVTAFRKCGTSLALRAPMSSSFDSIYKKMTPPSSGGAGHAHEAKFDPARHVSPVVAHELNNILTIIQGYADRLLLKHGDNPALDAHLKLISEAARRASILVRSAVPSETDLPTQPQPHFPPPPPVA
jgi:hypothetical protein